MRTSSVVNMGLVGKGVDGPTTSTMAAAGTDACPLIGLREVGSGASPGALGASSALHCSRAVAAGRLPLHGSARRYGCLPGARAPGRPATVDAW